jgi:peptidoglycan/LPS O-acetylase OafA/YrhL
MEARSFNVGAKVDNFLLGLPRTTFAYLIGIAMGRRWRERPPNLPIPPLLAIPAMPAILAAGWALGLNSWLFDYLFTAIACPLMIAGGFRLAGNNRLATLIGKLSFPLFAVQMPILEGTRMLDFNGIQGGLSALIGGILAAVLASALSRRQSAQWQEKAA